MLDPEAAGGPVEGEAGRTLAGIGEDIIEEAAKSARKGDKHSAALLLEYLLFMLIPVAGIVIMAVWAFSDKGSALRRNLARAMLIATVILLVLYFMIAMVLAPYFTAWLYDEWQEAQFWREDEEWAQRNKPTPEGAALCVPAREGWRRVPD